MKVTLQPSHRQRIALMRDAATEINACLNRHVYSRELTDDDLTALAHCARIVEIGVQSAAMLFRIQRGYDPDSINRMLNDVDVDADENSEGDE